MLKRDTQREEERRTETQRVYGSVPGVIGCVTAQKLMNWAAAGKVLCISKPSHKRDAALHHLQRSPQTWWGLGSSSLAVEGLPVLQAGRVRTLPETASLPNPIKHRSVLWPDPLTNCSLSSARAILKLSLSSHLSLRSRPSWKGNSALIPACGCLGSLLCALLCRHEELNFVFLRTAVAQ